MTADPATGPAALVRRALAIGDVRSAALFVPGATPGTMRLVAAAGIEGPALDGLVAAVQRPEHPVALALLDPGPTFDVLPVNPGGPRLRSHLPVRPSGDGTRGAPAIGVLALAHERATEPAERARLEALASRAAAELGEASGDGG